MTFNDFADIINQIQELNNPFTLDEFYKTPVKVMYNENEYNFHLSIDQHGTVTFINADDETTDIRSLISEVNEIKERLKNLGRSNIIMDHHYVMGYIITVDGDNITSKIVFYISDSEEL